MHQSDGVVVVVAMHACAVHAPCMRHACAVDVTVNLPFVVVVVTFPY
jgi:hypothetical protein